MNFNFYIAKRIGKERSVKGALSGTSNIIATVSVALSLFIMILSVAISNGFRKEIREKAVGFGGDMSITAPGVEITNDKYPILPLSYLNSIENEYFVKSVHPVYYSYGLLKTDDQIQGVVFKGVNAKYNWNFFNKHLCKGKLPDFTGTAMSNDILISKRMSEMMGYDIGDKVTAYFIGEDVRVRRFTVSGLYDAQLEDFDKVTVIADARQISRINGWDNKEVSGYEIFLKESAGENFDKYAESVAEIIEKNSSDSDDDALLTTVKDSFTLLFDWLKLLDTNVFIIIVLMIAVSGFNMVSGILIILFERVSQIGVLKALGMKTVDISKVFLYRTSFIVLKGLLYGNAFAALVCFLEWKFDIISLNPENYFVSSVPISISPLTFIIINAIAFVSIMLILVVPCHFISNISPAKTLKFE